MEDQGEITFNYLLKYIIVGDAAVGKSNLLLRYTHGVFRDEYQLTIGVEFGRNNEKINDQIFRIQIWDTAGQENFRSITRAYYKNSACALIVYDITRRASFESISSWIEDCRNSSPKSVMMVLVGNKVDLEEKREVSKDEGQEFADQNGLMFLETSAKTAQNILEAFNISAKSILSNIKKNEKKPKENTNINLNKEKEKEKQAEASGNKIQNKKKGCC